MRDEAATVAIIGYGSVGKRHARNLAAAGCRVLVVDIDTHDRDRCDVLEESDAALICTPAARHIEDAIEAANSNCHIFIEKPLAASWDPRVDELVRLVEAKSLYAAVGYNLRWHPELTGMKAAIERGEFGKISEGIFITESDIRTWRGASYADALAECSHELDLSLWLLGPARCISATREAAGGRWTIRLEHVSGATSSLLLSYAESAYNRCGTIAGNGLLRSYRLTAEDIEPTYGRETEAFLGMLRHRSHRCVPLNEGIAVLELIHQARELAVCPS